jgi:hypothetical protein
MIWGRWSSAPRGLRAYALDERGASGAELALWLTFMIFPFMNVVDLGYYVFQAMQVRAAAQAAADTAQTMCGQTAKVPAATQCNTLSPSLTTEMTTAVHSTLLGSAVSFTAGTTAGASGSAPYEGYYCTNTSNALVLATNTTNPWLITANAVATEPTDCSSAVTGNTDVPADYVVVTATYAYTPLFKNLSLVSLFQANSNITQVAWMRIS